MHRSIVASTLFATAMFGLLCSSPSAQEQVKAPSAAATFTKLESEFAELRAQMIARYERATPEEWQALPDVNLWPREQILPKVAKAAERFAGTPDAVRFHLWIVRDSRRLTDRSLALKSVDRLLDDHIEDERLERLAAWLHHFTRLFGVEGTLARLERLRKGTAKIEVQAACMLAHASVAPGSQVHLKSRLLEVIAFAPNTAGGHRAKARLFEIEHLEVGCTAPDIVGIDLDGVDFKLSDYKGKVIFLDFWGDW